MSVIPPLDRLTKAPALGVDKIQQQFNNILDSIVDQANKTIKDSAKLPTNVNSDDPRVKNIKQSLENIQLSITKVQENIPKIQSAITAVSTIISTAQGINAALAAAQLSNPVTAALFIALQTQALQNQLIVNAIEAVKPLQSLPKQIDSKIIMLMPILIAAISKLNTITDDDIELNVPSIPTDDVELNVSNISTELNMDTNYNDLIPTEFYNELNVSEDDLTQRSNSIEQLVDQQRNLLTSLQEAPSQVYRGNGNPLPNLGKIGDYYLNTSNNVSYGPKISDNDWGTPIN
jgi:hypothetical protein|tara:strand:+ start:480 stop:1349 length:870 start_codon:yes stop_codon:yes gene_type:complete